MLKLNVVCNTISHSNQNRCTVQAGQFLSRTDFQATITVTMFIIILLRYCGT